MPFRFANCVFDDGAHQLLRAGELQPLSPKAFRLLKVLLAARPQAVSRQELHDLLWPHWHVGHTSLARVVNELRAAVGDDPRRQRIVRTVHGFGYAFAADAAETAVEERAPGPGLLWAGHTIPLPAGDSIIGRGPDCDVRVPLPGVSRHHARIRVSEGGAATIEDLGSKNGTYVRKARIKAPTRLESGDEIQVGPAVLTYCLPDLSASTRTGSAGRKRHR